LQIAAATLRMQTKSDSAFYQITLVFVSILCRWQMAHKLAFCRVSEHVKEGNIASMVRNKTNYFEENPAFV